jgi:hypothetical protein
MSGPSSSDAVAFHIERDDASAPYFDGARAGQLMIRSCPDGSDLTWVPASGAAALITWAVDRAAPASTALLAAGGDGSVIGVVELAEGPWINTAIPGVDPASLTAGMPMHVSFLRLGDGEPVPVFAPANGIAAASAVPVPA